MSIIDINQPKEVIQINKAHNEDGILGLKIHRSSPLIASSGGDALVKIWDLRKMDNPILTYEEHQTSIKALVWSPLEPNIIASAGGLVDRTIRIWNTTTGQTLHSIDTGSQVCNLLWNEEYNEIFSTHGFSQNHLALWKGNDLSPIASYHTHTSRVLYMCASKDGSVATASPNDSLQIWKLFPSKTSTLSQSLLSLR